MGRLPHVIVFSDMLDEHWLFILCFLNQATVNVLELPATHSRLFNPHMVFSGLVVRYMNTNTRIIRADIYVPPVLTLHPLVTFTNVSLCLSWDVRGPETSFMSWVASFGLWTALVFLSHRWWNSVVAPMVWKPTTLRPRSCPPSLSISGNTGWLWTDATTDRLAHVQLKKSQFQGT